MRRPACDGCGGWIARARRLLTISCVIALASSATAATDWRGRWIWLPESDTSDMLLARRTFTLAEDPEQAHLAITASSRYELFVNGRSIARGPARAAAHHQSYDVVDVAGPLVEGKNVIAVRVHHQRDGVSHYDASRAGLLAQLDGVPVRVQTDGSWRVAPDESWDNEAPRMARFHLEVCDRVDLRRAAGGWKEAGYDDRAWAKARVLERDSGWPEPQTNDRPTHLVPPWTSLVERDIPYLEEVTVPAGEPVSETIPVPAARDDRLQVYDLGRVHPGRPFLDVDGPAGTVVEVMAAPYLLDGSLPSPVVASTYTDRIVLSGKRERWEAFYMKPTRWLAVVVRDSQGETTIHGTGVIRGDYPFVQQGRFRASKAPELEALWKAAAETIRVSTTDAYTDNYRERRQYAQTAFYASLGNYAVFGDTALQRRYLTQIALEQLANGIMPAYAPRHGDDFMVILDSNCFWLRGLWQYLLYSGDEATVRDLLPAAHKLLGLLASYTNPGGLIDSPPYPYWLDHAVQDRRGANFCLNAHYLGAVEDFARVLQWLGEPGAERHRTQAARMRQTLRGQFWDAEKQLFADAVIEGRRSDLFSEHANGMALALHVATPEQARAIAPQLLAGGTNDFIRHADGTTMVTPAMSYYLHAGLCEAGRADDSWELLHSRFAHMLAPGANGTLWEEWWLAATGRTGTLRPFPTGRSDAQTESAFPPALLARYVLGIDPASPGLEDVVLRYHPSARLQHREGAIPTPSGLLAVEWEISAENIELAVKAPETISVRLDLASVGRPGRSRIRVDGEHPSKDSVRGGQLLLPRGHSSVIIRKERE